MASIAHPSAPGEGGGKRALITGLRGFTGRYRARELAAAGYQVVGTARPGGAAEPGVFALDLCERDAVAALVAAVRPDVVAHLAGIAFVAHADAEQLYRVNLVATRNLLEALATQARPTAVLLASAANIYGNAGAGLIDETLAPAPTNDYADNKLAMEYMAHLWREQLSIVVVRPFNYTGVGQDERFLLPKIVAHFRRRARAIDLGNLAVSRDFSDVRTVAACFRRLLASVLATKEDIAGYRIEVRVNEVLTLAGSNARLQRAIGQVAATPLPDILRWMYSA